MFADHFVSAPNYIENTLDLTKCAKHATLNFWSLTIVYESGIRQKY